MKFSLQNIFIQYLFPCGKMGKPSFEKSHGFALKTRSDFIYLFIFDYLYKPFEEVF